MYIYIYFSCVINIKDEIWTIEKRRKKTLAFIIISKIFSRNKIKTTNINNS